MARKCIVRSWSKFDVLCHAATERARAGSVVMGVVLRAFGLRWGVWGGGVLLAALGCSTLPTQFEGKEGVTISTEGLVLVPGDSLQLGVTHADAFGISRWPPEVAYGWPSTNPGFSVDPESVGRVGPAGILVATAPGKGQVIVNTEYGTDRAHLSVVERRRPLRAAAIDAGDFHTCAVSKDRRVLCWGSNSHGQLGIGGSSSYRAFLSPLWVALDRTIEAVVTGGRFSCGLSVSEIWCWGDNSYGQVGIGRPEAVIDRPSLVLDSSSGAWLMMDAGATGACAVSAAGEVWCWGLNYGRRAVRVSTPEPMVRVVVGAQHLCGISVEGSAYCWGSNTFGQLGRPGASTDTAVRVHGVDSAVALSAGDLHTCAIDRDGQVYCWGNNWHGQLGNGQPSKIGPVSRVELGGGPAISVDAGGQFSCAVVDDGSAYCWGDNARGQVGGWPAPQFALLPTFVQSVPWPVRIETRQRSVRTGLEAHACAISVEETVTCWGLGKSGQVGLGRFPAIEGSEVPIQPSPGLVVEPIETN